MAEPVLLPYDPRVDSFSSRRLETESGQTISFEEASENSYYVEKALQVPPSNVPIEFTMFVLRKMAVHKEDFRSFKYALPSEALEYLQKLIGNHHPDEDSVHPENTRETPSCFRGAFVQIFCKKVISNLSVNNQEDNFYDTLAAVFPFQVSAHVPRYKMKILQKFDSTFYREIRRFLAMHFDTINEAKIVELFLLNIRNFISNHFSAESLLARLENPEGEHDDYLSTFHRLNAEGIEWFGFLYQEFVGAAQSYGFHVSEFYDNCDDEYFLRLPERNFADLYSFFDAEFFDNHRSIYTRRFKKYLFFFIHALEADYINPVFFIDDLLFESMKSLRRYKTVKEDISMKHDLVRITMLHYRMKLFSITSSRSAFSLSDTVLNRIREYISNRIIARNPRLNVKYETELIAWTPFRTNDACFNVRYSRKIRIAKFLERLLFCALCPDEEPVNCIITYNAFQGKEYRIDLPNGVEFVVRNFIRLCNTRSFVDLPFEPRRNTNEYNLSIFLPAEEKKGVSVIVMYKQILYLIFICMSMSIVFVILYFS
ncbi:uncharacterized protein LOC135849908 [Planococcus citri]|uniref:uncharacterized protein LOC135849908 n=1 Tax=Planococcus citri TaxID=170843 RepID=UPI0031F8F97B